MSHQNMLPFVSIVMPVRNEAAYIGRSLRAVLDQDYPADRMEVIVADGMSTDGTRNILQAMQAGYPILCLIDNPRQIVPAGLNLALQVARGDVIIRVDGHCEIAPDYVRRCVGHLQNGDVDGVGGALATVGETPLAQAIAVAMSSPFGVGGSAFRTAAGKTMLADTIPFPAYKRAAIERAGPYDEELVRNQDDEYNYRLRKQGARLLMTADVHARYYSRSSLRSLWRQYFQYGYWKVRVLQKHPRQMRARQFVPVLFVVTLLASLVLGLFHRIGRRLALLAGGAYLVANVAASLWTARQNGGRHLAVLPLAFAILHVSYGLGFLAGLFKFRNRWRDP